MEEAYEAKAFQKIFFDYLKKIDLEHLSYDAFAATCVEYLKILQDKLQSDYDLAWYDKWFYNQTTGLLTFSTGDAELNFKYIDIGSFSEESLTWKWSWDNDSTLENVKRETDAVKEFGLRSNFPKLVTGYFPSDEFEAREFAAIAVNLLNGIGVYRPVNEEKLQIFLVITEFIDDETAQRIKDKYVECDKHGQRRIAFVCKHLNRKSKTGFHEAFETFENMPLSDDDDFQAWCNECEIVREEEGEWNDRSMRFADIKLVCERCYFEIKELNLGHR